MLNMRQMRPEGQKGMVEAILQEWERISEVELLTFIDSMPEQIQLIIATSGGHTHW